MQYKVSHVTNAVIRRNFEKDAGLMTMLGSMALFSMLQPVISRMFSGGQNGQQGSNILSGLFGGQQQQEQAIQGAGNALDPTQMGTQSISQFSNPQELWTRGSPYSVYTYGEQYPGS